MSFQKVDSYNYVVKDKMPSGQTAEISFVTYENSNGDLAFWIVFDVYHKRKQKNENILKQTGKDGLTTLLWAKRKIKEFETFVLRSDESWIVGRPLSIIVGWEDNRRRNVYNRGLKDLGFEFNYWDDGKVLMKKIR